MIRTGDVKFDEIDFRKMSYYIFTDFEEYKRCLFEEAIKNAIDYNEGIFGFNELNSLFAGVEYVKEKIEQVTNVFTKKKFIYININCDWFLYNPFEAVLIELSNNYKIFDICRALDVSDIVENTVCEMEDISDEEIALFKKHLREVEQNNL